MLHFLHLVIETAVQNPRTGDLNRTILVQNWYESFLGYAFHPAGAGTAQAFAAPGDIARFDVREQGGGLVQHDGLLKRIHEVQRNAACRVASLLLCCDDADCLYHAMRVRYSLEWMNSLRIG